MNVFRFLKGGFIFSSFKHCSGVIPLRLLMAFEIYKFVNFNWTFNFKFSYQIFSIDSSLINWL